MENDKRNMYATVDLLKVYMANVAKYKIKTKEIFSNPTHKVGRHCADILLLKAVYSYLNGNTQTSVNLLIEAVKGNANCIDSLEVMVILIVVLELSYNVQFNFFQ